MSTSGEDRRGSEPSAGLVTSPALATATITSTPGAELPRARSAEFAGALTSTFIGNAYNSYSDNVDFDRFARPSLRSKAKRLVKKALSIVTGGYALVPNWSKRDKATLSTLVPQLEAYERLFTSLADDASRELLVKLIAYRTLGEERVKLPLAERNEYRRRVDDVRKLVTGDETIGVNFQGILLRSFDLGSMGFPIRLFGTAPGLMNTFLIEQYAYNQRSPPIKVERGDVVIDAGGCWGDTTLYFAHESGARVLVFEFIPSNLAVLNRNIEMNGPITSDVVSVIPHPVWGISGTPVYCRDAGPGSRVMLERKDPQDTVVLTKSIDDMAVEQRLDRVDFIKMDIEGAELEALAGARSVIQKHRPKLAISVYHRPTDITAIPEYIQSLGIPYDYYLGHYTIHNEETVVFATPKR